MCVGDDGTTFYDIVGTYSIGTFLSLKVGLVPMETTHANDLSHPGWMVHLLLKCKISKFSDLDGSDYDGDHPTSRRPILRSRKSSIGDDRASSPEFLQSILKRRSSQEDMVSFGF